jgi:electron transfer flavoprotein beta subunit
LLAEVLDRPGVRVGAWVVLVGVGIVCQGVVVGGVDVVEARLRAVVTITTGEYDPRLPSLKGIMAAKKKPLAEKDAQLGTSRIQVRELMPPPERPAGRIVGQGSDAVPELVRLLREEAKVLS